MFKHLFKIRYLMLVIVILSAGHGIAFMAMGTLSAFKAYKLVLAGAQAGRHASESERPGLELLHSLDFLFVSMVLIVLSLGIAKLFLMNAGEKVSADLPAWLRIESIAELKVLLWETSLTTLMIIALSQLSAVMFTEPQWTMLLTPAAILILALSLYLIKRE